MDELGESKIMYGVCLAEVTPGHFVKGVPQVSRDDPAESGAHPGAHRSGA